MLFVCTGNSARSPMAEALLRQRSCGRVEARSAGSHPKPMHPDAVRVMRERFGLDLSGRRPVHLGELAHERFDRVVTLCDRVREICPELPGPAPTSHWSLPDPAAATGGGVPGASVFEDLAVELEARIDLLLAELAARPAAQR